MQINIPKPKSAEFAIMESKLMIYEVREWMKELPTNFKPFEWFFLLAHKRIFLALLISNILRMLGYIIGVVVLNNFLGWKNINYVVVPAFITLIILFFVCICYKNKLDKTYSFIIMITVSILFEMIRIREIHKHIPISMYLEIYNMHLFTTGLAYFYCLISEKHAQKFKYLKAIAAFMIGGLFALITGIVFFYEYYYQLEIYLFVYLILRIVF